MKRKAKRLFIKLVTGQYADAGWIEEIAKALEKAYKNGFDDGRYSQLI